MSSRRRKSKTIGFKAFYDNDADLLAWWEGMPEGERSQVLRDLLRVTINGKRMAPTSSGHSANGQQLAQVYEDTTWIRNALSDLPAYLERLIGQLQRERPLSQVALPNEPQEDGPRLEPDAIERRKTKMRQNVW